MHLTSWTEIMLKDLRFALRQCVRNPVFTTVAVLSLALGIGANTAIFSIIDAVLLRSLPVHEPQNLVILTDPNFSGVSDGMDEGIRRVISYAEFTELRDHATKLAGLCAAQTGLRRWPVRIDAGSQEEARGRLVSENYFSVLGVDASIGRLFTQADAGGVGQDPYMVISYDYWQRRFGGNVGVLGTPVRLQNTAFTIIGVARPDFRGEGAAERPDFWIPVLMQNAVMPGRDWLHEDTSRSVEKVMWLHAIGRLRSGVTQGQAQNEIDVLFHDVLVNGYPANLGPETRKQVLNQRLKLSEARTGTFGGRDDFSQQLVVLLAVSTVVLLIACINVANLLLARATARYKEVGVRLSIGASRSRLLRQFLTESVVLSGFGGVAGLMLAWGASRGLALLLAGNHGGDLAVSSGLDWRVLGFTLGVTLITGLLFGLAPALRAIRVNINNSLRDAGRGITSGGSKLNMAKGLVIAQVALSLLLVAGAGLFLRTLWNLQAIGLGYPKEKLLMATVDGLNAGYKGERLSPLWRDITDRLRAVPGVQGVTYSMDGLFTGVEADDGVEVEGFIPQNGKQKSSVFDLVGPQYFATLGIPLVLGRDIGTHDSASAPKVCVINEAFARTFFVGRSPIGRHVMNKFGDKKVAYEIVGISRNARDHQLRGEVTPRYYVPADQFGNGLEWATFEIRTAGDPDQVLPAVRKVIHGVDENLPIEDAQALTINIDRANDQPRMIARLSIIFGSVALLLAATGLYGVLSYGVARRTNEIGIRMALGAGRGRVVAMILRETGIMMVMGVIAGAVATVFAARLVASRLYGLSVLDSVTIITAIGILAAVALIAGYVPAARAARVNPTQALRHD